LGWELPIWWKDALVLYLAMGGATAQGHHFDKWLWRSRVSANDGTEDDYERYSRLAAENDWVALQLLPLRFIAWPLFLLVFGVLEIVREFSLSPEVVVHGYVGSAMGEFLKLFLGALIFAGLNAGL
jgi:hypothetical protein